MQQLCAYLRANERQAALPFIFTETLLISYKDSQAMGERLLSQLFCCWSRLPHKRRAVILSSFSPSSRLDGSDAFPRGLQDQTLLEQTLICHKAVFDRVL